MIVFVPKSEDIPWVVATCCKALIHTSTLLKWHAKSKTLKPHLLTFSSFSARSSENGASVSVSSYNIGADPSAQRKYLETSLDGDSYAENIYDDYQLNRFSPTSSAVTYESEISDRSKPPLETAM